MTSAALLPLAVELLETVGADDAPRRLGLDTAQARPPRRSLLRKRFSLFVLHFTLRVLMQTKIVLTKASHSTPRVRLPSGAAVTGRQVAASLLSGPRSTSGISSSLVMQHVAPTPNAGF